MDIKTLITVALAGLIGATAGAADAQVYKVRDAQGNVTYTDTPPKDRPYEEVDLRPINSQAPVEANSGNQQDQAQEEQTEPVNYALRMAQPDDGTQVPPGQRDLQLAVELSPQLEEGHQIQFMMNGKPLGQPTHSANWVVREIYRGEHQVSARLLDSNNRVLAEAPAVTVYVQRPTVLSPARNTR